MIKYSIKSLVNKLQNSLRNSGLGLEPWNFRLLQYEPHPLWENGQLCKSIILEIDPFTSWLHYALRFDPSFETLLKYFLVLYIQNHLMNKIY